MYDIAVFKGCVIAVAFILGVLLCLGGIEAALLYFFPKQFREPLPVEIDSNPLTNEELADLYDGNT